MYVYLLCVYITYMYSMLCVYTYIYIYMCVYMYIKPIGSFSLEKENSPTVTLIHRAIN